MALIRLNVTDPNATNAFLTSLTGKPVGQPPALGNIARLGQVSQGNFTYVSTNVATALGFSFGGVASSAARRVMTFDYAATANQTDTQDNGIDSWTYGAGYRIGILTFEADAKAELPLAALAATATLERKQLQIQVVRYGMPGGPPIPVPDFSTFDVAAFGLFTQWQRDVIDYMSRNRAQLRPVRIYASLAIDVDQYYNSTAPVRYALRRIEDGHTLEWSLRVARDRQIPHVAGHDAVIRAVYAAVTGLGRYLDESGPIDNSAISDAAKRAARTRVQEFARIR